MWILLRLIFIPYHDNSVLKFVLIRKEAKFNPCYLAKVDVCEKICFVRVYFVRIKICFVHNNKFLLACVV